MEDIRILFLKLKSRMGHPHDLLTTRKTSPVENKITVVETQQLPDL